MSNHRTINPSRVLLRLPRLGRRAGTLAAAACAVLLVGGAPDLAWAVSTRDLIELSKAGLGDEVLVALVEADGTVFSLDAPKILELRAAGVSERVITAMLKNASRPSPASSPVAATERAAADTACARRTGRRAVLRHHRRETCGTANAPGTDLHRPLGALLGGHEPPSRASRKAHD